MTQLLDAVVIGAGQAGLAMGYYLNKSSLSFEIIGSEERIGDTWRNRYDSLVLFTPRNYSTLPGMSFPGDPNGYPNKDEVADYLENYANHFSLPIKLNTTVQSVEKSDEGFVINTSNGIKVAKRVIVAAGPFQRPIIPSIAKQLNDDIYQMHSSSYQNPFQLPDGPCLVVGGGNSGAQFAAEISKHVPVHLAIGHKLKFFPLEFMGRSIFWGFDKLRILHAPSDSLLGTFVRKQPHPIFGLELKRLIRKGNVQLKPKVVSCAGNEVSFQDGRKLSPRSIVWATGFTPDFHWLQLPEVLDTKGKPIHTRGVSKIAGLYFLGQPWQHCRTSALLGGVGSDAEFIYHQLLSN